MRRLQELTLKLCKIIVEYCDIQLKLKNPDYELRAQKEIIAMLSLNKNELQFTLANLITTITDPQNNGYGTRQSFLELYLTAFTKIHPLVYSDVLLTKEQEDEVFNELNFLLETSQQLLTTSDAAFINVNYGNKNTLMPGMARNNSANIGFRLLNYVKSSPEWLNWLNQNLTVMGSVVEKNTFTESCFSPNNTEYNKEIILSAIQEEQEIRRLKQERKEQKQIIKSLERYVSTLESDSRELEKKITEDTQELTIATEENQRLTAKNRNLEQKLCQQSLAPLFRFGVIHSSGSKNSSSFPKVATPYNELSFFPAVEDKVHNQDVGLNNESNTLSTNIQETDDKGYDCF